MVKNSNYYNDAFFENLKTEFGDYQIYDNGVVEATSPTGDILLINTNIVPSGDASLVNLGCGWTTAANTYQYSDIIERYKSETPPDYFVTIPANCRDSNNAGLMAMNVFDSSGGDIPKVQPSAYSGSGAYILQHTISLLKEHPTASVDAIVLNETDLEHFMSEAGSDLSYIREHNIPIILNLPVDSNGNPSNDNAVVSNTINVLARQNIDTYVVTSSATSHEGLLLDLQSEGGIVDCMVDGTVSQYDKVYRYVDGKFVLVNNPFNFNAKTDLDNDKLQIFDSDIRQKYAYLLEMPDVFIKYNDNQKVISGGEGNVSCDIEYLTYSMNQFKSQIRANNFLSSLPSIGGPGIIGTIGKYFSAYFSMVGSLTDSFNQEIDAITSYGQYYVDFDNYLANAAADTIGDISDVEESSVPVGGSTPPVAAPEAGTQTEVSSDTGGTEELSATVDKTTSSPATAGPSTQTAASVSQVDTSTSETSTHFDSYIDTNSSKLFAFDDGSKLSFSLDDDTITKAVYLVDINANENILSKMSLFEDNNIFDSFSIENNELKAVFNSDFIRDKSMDQIRAAIKEWMGNNE